VHCPRCNGEKTMEGFITTSSGCSYGAITCYTCNGSGEVADPVAEDIETGKQLRLKRLASDFSLRELAKKLEIRGAWLVSFERGEVPIADWPPVVQQFMKVS